MACFALTGHFVNNKVYLPREISSHIDLLCKPEVVIRCDGCRRGLLGLQTIKPIVKHVPFSWTYFANNLFVDEVPLLPAACSSGAHKNLQTHTTTVSSTPETVSVSNQVYKNEVRKMVCLNHYRCMHRDNEWYYLCDTCFFTMRIVRKYFNLWLTRSQIRHIHTILLETNYGVALH